MNISAYERIKSSGRLPSPSGVALELMRLVDDDKSTLDQITAAVELDPAIASRLLKLVNSPFYGASRTIAAVSTAVKLLGRNTVKNLALGLSLLATNRKGSSRAFDFERFWSESVARAVTARGLASHIGGCLPDEAFTVGLLAKIGHIALATAFPKAYDDLLGRVGSTSLPALLEAERSAFQIDHNELTAAMMADWRLADVFCESVRRQDAPSDASGWCENPFSHPAGASIDDACARIPSDACARISSDACARIPSDACARIPSDACARIPSDAGARIPSRTPADAGARIPSRTPGDDDTRTARISRLLHLSGAAAAVLVEPNVFHEHLAALLNTAHALGVEGDVFTEVFDAAKEEWRNLGTVLSVRTRQTPSLRETHTRASRMQPNIVVVDDDPAALRLLARYLADSGYKVLTATNGIEALRIIHARGCQLVVTDWHMPEMDGIELCRAIRSSEGIGFVYVIILTGCADDDSLPRAFDAGVDDYLTKPLQKQELLARLKAGVRALALEAKLASQQRATHKTNAELAVLNDKLQRMATTDELTGLHNRREAMRRLEELWAAAVRNDWSLACMMLDIDHFKRCNDAHGHDAGDVVLRETAHVLKCNARAGEMLFRIGGEEFVVLCPGATSEKAAVGAERLRAAVEANRILRNDTTLSVTISIGVAQRDAGTDNPDDLLKLADEALYEAKRGGRNRVCLTGGGGWPTSSGGGEHDDRNRQALSRSAARQSSTPPCPKDMGHPPESYSSPASRHGGRPLHARHGGWPASSGGGAGGGGRDDRHRAVDRHESILVVDDDPSARRLVRTLLERDGFEVHEACDGLDALAKLPDIRPQVILMDVEMPNLNGLDCTRTLKADPAFHDIPVIIVSAETNSHHLRAGLDAGAQEYITKPIQHDEFLLRVRAMSEFHRSQANLFRSNAVRGEQARAMGVLFDLSRSLASAESLDAIVTRTAAATAELMNSHRVSVMLPNDTGQYLYVAAAIGINEQLAARIKVPVGSAIAGRVFASGTPTVLNAPGDITDGTGRYDSDFFASVPLASSALAVANKVVGVLNVAERYDGRPFEAQEIEYLDLVSNMAASCLEQFQIGQARARAHAAIVIGLAKLAEHRDSNTGKHLERVTRYALLLAEELRKSSPYASIIDDWFLEELEQSMPLHDIGKVSVPDAILLKPGPLSEAEFAAMKRHAVVGAGAIQSMIEQAPDADFLTMARDIAHFHHEWFDGSGYPEGLTGDEIPLAARIAAVADVYDALTTERPYKEAFSHERAVEVIRGSSGSHFDSEVVDAFQRLERRFAELAAQLEDHLGAGWKPAPQEEAVGSAVCT